MGRDHKALFNMGAACMILSLLMSAQRASSRFVETAGVNDLRPNRDSSPIVLVAGAEHQTYSVTNAEADPSRMLQTDRSFFEYVTSILKDKPYPGLDIYIRYTTARLGLKPLKGVRPLRPENLGRIVNDVTAYRYPLDVNPCRSSKRYVQKPSLFVAIISAVGNFEDRQRIRPSWLHTLKELELFDLVGYAFFVGKSRSDNATAIQRMLEEESAAYGDIVQVDMLDSYKDLTVKFVGVLNWLNDNCRQVDYVMKVDDDIFVNVRNLATVTKSVSPLSPAIYGFPISWMFIRKEGSKYQVTYDEWPWSTIPVFTIGSCILITSVSIPALLAASQVVPYFYQDDFYLTALLNKEANVNIYTSKDFLDFWSKYPLDNCFVRDTVSWSARTEEETNASQLAVEQFYNRQVPCRLKAHNDVPRRPRKAYLSSLNDTSTGETIIADPIEPVSFEFQLVQD